MVDRVPIGNKVVRVPKTSELVVVQLRRQIIKGELQEGEALPSESVLIEEFGVSRPTLREAYRVLESENLIAVKRGSHGGARVQAPNGDVAARYAGLVLEYAGTTLADVFEAAAVMEGHCVGMLAYSKDKALIAKLWDAVKAEESLEELADVLEAQVAFHQLVIDLSGNKTMKVLADMVRHIINLASRAGMESEGVSERQSKATHVGSKMHRRLVELIAAGEATEAEDLWRKHVLDTSAFLEKALGGPQTVLDLLG